MLPITFDSDAPVYGIQAAESATEVGADQQCKRSEPSDDTVALVAVAAIAITVLWCAVLGYMVAQLI